MTDARQVWALGDFPRIARETISGTGDLLVAECGVQAGQRVLDVAAGSGNVALPAARAGARVIASDITPELLAAGRADAEAEGLRLHWVEADAQALPFDDDAFDVVLSSFGAMFAPDHVRTAGELTRVCRPGGTIGMVNWTPQGWAGRFFATVSAFAAPPPPGAQPPVLWGDEAHVRGLFGARVSTLRAEPRTLAIEHFEAPIDLVTYYRANFGPVIATYAALGDDPERVAALDAALLDFATQTNLDPDGARWELEFLLVVAQAAPSA
ncbi:class I SAM-dependent methyltransferase [Conexibacter stalactiti]|uniref:Class I SAM-dependent methyltransferase n=1 Tax=Conexibacter stalactiti TaxID=1940611 RepID=A0ABU4HHH7_9ACTN|nr:class I SAM-dependent methyltransferase [Conexibacter stalactiti]MDW5592764.1 class I SAM-dependent methyltransferase [Conexibacter stalactiti]MEC5033405.1 class I SAM-dependent methyltransferase [Conexibacter stalactiti]